MMTKSEIRERVEHLATLVRKAQDRYAEMAFRFRDGRAGLDDLMAAARDMSNTELAHMIASPLLRPRLLLEISDEVLRQAQTAPQAGAPS